jgi:hypothetical protein
MSNLLILFEYRRFIVLCLCSGNIPVARTEE